MSKRVKLLVGAGGALTLVAIALAGLMATGSVLAQTPPAGGKAAAVGGPLGEMAQNFISKLAKNLGIGEDTLRDAVKNTEKQMVDEGVQQGRINKDAGDKLKDRIDKSQNGIAPFGRPTPWMGRPGPLARGMQKHFGGMMIGRIGARQAVSDTAQLLGLSMADIQTQLRGGKSLAEIAAQSAKKIGRDDLIKALVAKDTERINQRVTDGKLTRAQADKLIGQLQNAIGRIVDMKFPGGGIKPGAAPQGGANPQAPVKPQRLVPRGMPFGGSA